MTDSKPLTENIDEKPFHYKHARPYVAVDCVVFGIMPENDNNLLHVLLRRKTNVKKKKKEWVLPGRILQGGIDPGNEFDGAETLVQVIIRALTFSIELSRSESKRFESEEYTHQDTSRTITYSLIDPNSIIQIEGDETLTPEGSHEVHAGPMVEFTQLLAKFSPTRDWRQRTISVPYMLMTMPRERIPDYFEEDLKWFPVNDISQLPIGYDHCEIISQALQRLSEIARTQPIGRGMLNNKFTINDIAHLYETILDYPSLDRSNLKKLLLQRRLILPSTENPPQGGHLQGRQEYFEFDESVYSDYQKNKDFAFNPRPRQSQKK